MSYFFKWSIVALIAFVLVVPAIAAAQDTVTIPPWRRELPGGRQNATITVGETSLQVDLAIDPWEQTLGLGYRNGHAPGTGMLFINHEAREQTFWMKGMRFCLDIIWIVDGEIVGAAENACPDPTGTPDIDRQRYRSDQPVTHILEVPAGWLADHGYGPGTDIDLSGVPD
jgi:uncharacterized protein